MNGEYCEIIFVYSDSLISRAIRWWTDSPYSHVIIRTQRGHYEARARGFQYHPLGTWAPQEGFVYDVINVPVPMIEKTQIWLDDHVGKPYDFLGAAAFMLPFVKETKLALYCSEAAQLSLAAGGVAMIDEPLHPGALRWYLKGLVSTKVFAEDVD